MSSRRRSIYVESFLHVNPTPAACRIGDIVYSAVITGRDPVTNKPAATLDEQAVFLFQHLRAVLSASGVTPDDVVKVNVWLKDRDDRVALNREWLALYPDPDDRPARQSHAADLDNGLLITCEFVAVAAPTP